MIEGGGLCIRRAAAAALAALLAFAPLADARQQRSAPPRDQLRATDDSPFIQRLMREPFTADHGENMVRIRILEESGNALEGKLLQSADDRRALSLMTGEAYALPPTVGDAIAAEKSGPPFAEAARKAFERVTIEYSKERLDSKNREATVRNDLALPVTSLWFRIGTTTYFCPTEDEPPASRAVFEPGKATHVTCHTNDTAFNDDSAQPVNPYAVRTAAGSLVGGPDKAFFSTERDEGLGQAWSRLAQAPCAEKGQCAEVRQAERTRQAAQARDERPVMVVLVGGVLAFVAALVAALRVRKEPEPAGVFRSFLSLGVIAYSFILLALLHFGVRPHHARYADVLPFAFVVFGGLPFLAALAVVGASMRRHPLHAFAATLGIGTVLVVVAVLMTGA